MSLALAAVKPSLASPRFFPGSEPEGIDAALENIGHAVLENVWPTSFINALRAATAEKFQADDALNLGRIEAMEAAEREIYLGNFTCLDGLPDPWGWDARFYEQFSGSPLPRLYHHLFGGAFVLARNERVLRRSDPRFPLRFAGLHFDGQLGPARLAARCRQRELTLWTPLVDCLDEETSRLLLLHRGEGIGALFTETVTSRGVDFAPVMLRPWQFRDDEFDAINPTVMRQFEKLYRERRCYAPKVGIGDAILFDHAIVHSSYIPAAGVRRVRYSMDCRAIGEYEVTDANRAYSGKLFRRRRILGGYKATEYPAS